MRLSCSRTLGGSVSSREINASPQTLWETVVSSFDPHQAAKIRTMVLEQEIVDQKDDCVQVGTVIREVRQIMGKRHETYKTVTSIINDSKPPYSMSFNLNISKEGALKKHDTAARTVSLTVVQGTSAATSVMVISYSIVLEDWNEMLMARICCRPCLVRELHKGIRQDLSDYAQEAERRQAIKEENIK
jgi:hypothetical protein